MVVWTILTLSATLGIVGLVGLLHACWTSARASQVSPGNEAHSTNNLLLYKEGYDTGACGQQSNVAVACVSTKQA